MSYTKTMGILYIVATPIGNLKDITLRTLATLKEVDFVVCEDTRHTAKLLNYYGVSKSLVSYFQHSKLSKIEYIIGELGRGKKVALVTDAGTPGISDPGGKLIEHITRNMEQDGREIEIVPVPGASAVTAALSISGLPADKFIFMGFPPHKKGREKFFREVAETKYTVVFYESVHRIIKTLEQLVASLRGGSPFTKRGATKQSRGNASGSLLRLSADRDDGKRRIVVCRELTKQFETIYRGNVNEVLEKVKNDKIKGEYVVIIH